MSDKLMFVIFPFIFLLFGIGRLCYLIFYVKKIRKLNQTSPKLPATIKGKTEETRRTFDGFYLSSYYNYTVEIYLNGEYLECTIESKNLYNESLQTYVRFDLDNNSYMLENDTDKRINHLKKTTIFSLIFSFIIGIDFDLIFLSSKIFNNNLVTIYTVAINFLVVAIINLFIIIHRFIDLREKTIVKGILVDITKSVRNKSGHSHYWPVFSYTYNNEQKKHFSKIQYVKLPQEGLTTNIYIGKSGKSYEAKDNQMNKALIFIFSLMAAFFYLLALFTEV